MVIPAPRPCKSRPGTHKTIEPATYSTANVSKKRCLGDVVLRKISFERRSRLSAKPRGCCSERWRSDTIKYWKSVVEHKRVICEGLRSRTSFSESMRLCD
jgi:hypothetical protein